MKLFIVIYIAGHMGGSIGPVPYGMEECKDRAEAFLSKGDPNAVTPEGYTIKDVQFVCEWHDQRPSLEEEK